MKFAGVDALGRGLDESQELGSPPAPARCIRRSDSRRRRPEQLRSFLADSLGRIWKTTTCPAISGRLPQACSRPLAPTPLSWWGPNLAASTWLPVAMRFAGTAYSSLRKHPGIGERPGPGLQARHLCVEVPGLHDRVTRADSRTVIPSKAAIVEASTPWQTSWRLPAESDYSVQERSLLSLRVLSKNPTGSKCSTQ